MRKKELNLGEQLVEVLTKDLLAENFDDCVKRFPIERIGSIARFKRQFNCTGHILDGIIATYECGFEADDYIVKHDVLRYSICYDVAKKLFYAMDRAHQRNEDKEIKANEKKIVDYLNARNNPMAFDHTECSPIIWKESPTTGLSMNDQTIKLNINGSNNGSSVRS